jgi:hypothetical protein
MEHERDHSSSSDGCKSHLIYQTNTLTSESYMKYWTQFVMAPDSSDREHSIQMLPLEQQPEK